MVTKLICCRPATTAARVERIRVRMTAARSLRRSAAETAVLKRRRGRGTREHDDEFSSPDDEIAEIINYNDFGDRV